MQDSHSKKKVMQEVYIMQKIRHSNIIRLYEKFEDEKYIFLVISAAKSN